MECPVLFGQEPGNGGLFNALECRRRRPRRGPPQHTSAPNPKFAGQCRESDRELRVQRGPRSMGLQVALDSEVRLRMCRECWRTSEMGPLVEIIRLPLTGS